MVTRYLTVPQVAKELQVSSNKVWAWIDSKSLRANRLLC